MDGPLRLPSDLIGVVPVDLELNVVAAPAVVDDLAKLPLSNVVPKCGGGRAGGFGRWLLFGVLDVSRAVWLLDNRGFARFRAWRGGRRG